MKLLEVLAGESFCRVAEAQTSRGNQVRLLKDAAEAYPAWLGAINCASQTVYLENYIIQEDAAGAAFADALVAAAGRGVKCRVLYDWMGCLTRTPKGFWRRLEAAGVEVRNYNPPHWRNPFGWISRDHRKVLYVDGAVAFTGGLCIGHDWVGVPEKNRAPWRDTAVEIRGPAVAQIGMAFADSWAAAGQEMPPAPPLQDVPAQGGVDLSVIAGRPNSMGLYRLEQLVAEIAEQSLWLTDGYFVATTGYIKALAGAARAGVDTRLLVPGSSNWPIVGALSKSAYRPLLQAGVRVFEWNGPMLHAKTAVADSCWSRIGSSNSNLASWVSNRELDVTINDRRLAAEMEAMYEQDLENSTEIILYTGSSGVAKPRSASNLQYPRRPQISASRFLSSTIGFSSTLGASLTHHRRLGPAEAAVMLGGGFLLLFIGLVAMFAPRLIAYPIAFTALWFAAGYLVHALKLWSGRGAPHPDDGI